MRYKFKVTEDGKEEIEKEAMSFKNRYIHAKMDREEANIQ